MRWLTALAKEAGHGCWVYVTAGGVPYGLGRIVALHVAIHPSSTLYQIYQREMFGTSVFEAAVRPGPARSRTTTASMS